MLGLDDFAVGLLIEEGLLDHASLERARRTAAEKHGTVAEALVREGLVPAGVMAIARAGVCECPYIDLARFTIDLRHAALLDRATALKHMAFPVFDLGEIVTVAMADPLDLRAVDEIRGRLRREVEAALAEPEALRSLIERAYSLTAGDDSPAAEAPAEPASDAAEEPVVAAVNQIIAQAIQEGASDIHLGCDDTDLHLRYRIDGVLQARQGPRRSMHAAIVQRLKVMANLDLTQTRRPQDGKVRVVQSGRPVDLRVSLLPTVAGENVVIRVLAGHQSLRGFAELGFSPGMGGQLRALLDHPHGMLLVTGPTGSGKTTTLYTALKSLNSPDVNIMTIEDPVEIRLPLVRQVQANAEVGLTFAGALRSILRQDPDIVLVGEIRDAETATIAVQAALTGHLVLSTLHTNDAPGAIARLADFGVAPFAIHASLLGVLAQRLVRRVCVDCAGPWKEDGVLLGRFDLSAQDRAGLRAGRGCARCLGAGMRGRAGVYELLAVNGGVREAIDRGISTSVLRREAIKAGMKPLWMDGLEKACAGITTLEEVGRLGAATLDDDLAVLRGAAPVRLSA